MAKEVAISKRVKISQAQQYVLLAVLGSAVFLGAALSLTAHFIKQISFNVDVIMEEEKAIVSYSDTIKNIGVCEAPKGSIYTDEELKLCDPDSIDASSVPGTLRANILEGIASNEALSSVPNENNSQCINASTGKNYTYSEMNKLYNDAANTAMRVYYSKLIQSCSALRVIPDALPKIKNEEALLSSLNAIFLLSGFEPSGLSPTGSSGVVSMGENLRYITVSLSVEESSSATTIRFLDNVERSIREFNINRATIKWGNNDTLDISAQATAFYMEPSSIVEVKKVFNAEDN